MKRLKINKNILEEILGTREEKQITFSARYDDILNCGIGFDKIEGMPTFKNVSGYFLLLLNWRLEQ